jgi:hypothetical protein
MLAIAGTSTTANAQDKLDRALREGKRSGKSQRVIVKASPVTKPGRASCSRSRARTSTPSCRVSAALRVELTVGELDICKSAVLEGCSEDSYVSPMGGEERLQGAHDRRRRRRPKPWQPTLAKSARRPINTLLGTLGLTPSSSFGYGVTVALIDSGILSVDGVLGRIKAFYDFHRRNDPVQAPFDDYGHGTHVAGLIGGIPTSRCRVRRCRAGGAFVGLKVLDQNGGGRTSDVIRAIEFAIATSGGSASTSSTCRSATRSSSRPRPTRSSRRLRRPRKPASSSWRRQATTASTPKVRLASRASPRPATRRRRSRLARRITTRR